MINQILFLFCCISIGCANDNNRSISAVKRFRYPIDTLQLINRIKEQYAEINSKTATYNKVEKDVYGESAEGGVIIASYDNKDLKKITTTFYGETGKAVTEYYFDKDSLFFAFSTQYFMINQCIWKVLKLLQHKKADITF